MGQIQIDMEATNKAISKIVMMEMCITSKCNLHCKHCYQAFEKNHYELSWTEMIDVVDYARSKSCPQYVISGGEMFVHPDAYNLLDYILATTDASITCVTNLSVINIDKILSLPSDRVTFKVSIDGDEEAHDSRRGTGLFSRVCENIRILKEHGFTVDITMTLVEDNIYTLPAVLSNPLFEGITLMPVATTGAACEFYSHESDSPEYEAVVKHIYQTCRTYRDGSHRCILFPRCFSIKYDGGIYPCSLARDYGLCKIGSLKDGLIVQQVESFLQSSSSDMFFSYKCNAQIDACNNCKNNDECPRGCRIRAYKATGTLLSPDPFACKLFKGSYKDIPFGKIYWGSTK